MNSMTSIEVYLEVAQHSTTQNTNSKTSKLLIARFYAAMTSIAKFEAVTSTEHVMKVLKWLQGSGPPDATGTRFEIHVHG